MRRLLVLQLWPNWILLVIDKLKPARVCSPNPTGACKFNLSKERVIKIKCFRAYIHRVSILYQLRIKSLAHIALRKKRQFFARLVVAINLENGIIFPVKNGTGKEHYSNSKSFSPSCNSLVYLRSPRCPLRLHSSFQILPYGL